MELPLSRLYALLHSELRQIFKYIPGMDVDQIPPLAKASNEELYIEEPFFEISSVLTMKHESVLPASSPEIVRP
jgi:hypothetical protein